MLVLLMGEICDLSLEMASCGMVSFMKIGAGVQAILRFYLSNLRSCNVGITDWRDLRSH